VGTLFSAGFSICFLFYRETAHTTTLIAVTAANSTAIQRIVATFLSGRNPFGEGSGCEG
jgi:energy-converting hydrogenase Eha subunit E